MAGPTGLMRKWLAGKLSAFGGCLVQLADRLYPPPELHYRPGLGVLDVQAFHERAMRAQRAASRWN